MTQSAASPPSRGGAAAGREAWTLGLLALLPVPFLGLALAAVAMWGTSSTRRRQGGEIVRENARRAANWGLTVLLVLAACVVAALAGVATSTGVVVAVAGGVVLALTVVHLVVTAWGMAVARERVFRLVLAIPFIRH